MKSSARLVLLLVAVFYLLLVCSLAAPTKKEKPRADTSKVSEPIKSKVTENKSGKKEVQIDEKDKTPLLPVVKAAAAVANEPKVITAHKARAKSHLKNGNTVKTAGTRSGQRSKGQKNTKNQANMPSPTTRPRGQGSKKPNAISFDINNSGDVENIDEGGNGFVTGGNRGVDCDSSEENNGNTDGSRNTKKDGWGAFKSGKGGYRTGSGFGRHFKGGNRNGGGGDFGVGDGGQKNWSGDNRQKSGGGPKKFHPDDGNYGGDAGEDISSEGDGGSGPEAQFQF